MKFVGNNEIISLMQVPVESGGGSYPFTIDVPRITRFLFTNRAHTPAKAIAKSSFIKWVLSLYFD